MKLFFILLLFLVNPSLAIYWQPFVSFLPTYQEVYAPQWAGLCDEQLAVPHYERRWCENSLLCILNHSDELTKLNLAGAAILLGLTPTILGNIAPAIESLAFLSGQRPLLWFLLAASSAATNTLNPLGNVNPLADVLDGITKQKRFDRLMRSHGRTSTVIINVLEYLFATAAAINVIHLSYDLTTKVVVAWSCPNWAWVIGWSSIPAILHLFSTIIFRLTIKSNGKSPVACPLPETQVEQQSTIVGYSSMPQSPDSIDYMLSSTKGAANRPNFNSTGASGIHEQPIELRHTFQRKGTDPSEGVTVGLSPPLQQYSQFARASSNTPLMPNYESHYLAKTSQRSPSYLGRFLDFLWRYEFQPCAQRILPIYNINQSTISQLGRWVSPILSYVQYIGGTAILASLFPVVVRDAFPILARYVASGVVCRIIVSFEIDGLSAKNAQWPREMRAKLEHRNDGLDSGK